MSNADVLRRALLLVQDPRPELPDEELAKVFTPDVVVDMAGRVIDPKVYRGFDGLREYVDDLREAWEGVVFEAKEVIEEGDCVLGFNRMTGRGRSSGLPIDEDAAGLWRIADGRISHHYFLGYVEREEALAALHTYAAR